MAIHNAYPYHLWADGEWHILTQGVDFLVTPASVRITLNAWAKKNGRTLRFRPIGNDQYHIQFYKGGPRCQYEPCGEEFVRRTNAQKFCETCVPVGDLRARAHMTKYRVSAPQYARMVENTGPKQLCPICELWKATVIDHKHHDGCGDPRKTGTTCGRCTRGLLCAGCNLNIERIENKRLVADEVIPIRALNYIKRWDQYLEL